MSDNVTLSPEAVVLADRIGELLATMRAAEASLGAVLVEIEQRGVRELFGYRSVVRLLEQLGDMPRSAAARVVKRARALNPGRDPDGGVVPALAPATAVAARAGRLSNPMIDVIVDALTDIPPERRDVVEAHLLSFTGEAGYRQVALAARVLEPGPVERAVPARELSLRRKRTGVWELHGRFDDETGTRASALLDALAQRRPADDGGADSRSPRERYGDAFSDAVDLASNSPDLPAQAGKRAPAHRSRPRRVTVPISGIDLETEAGQTTSGDGGRVSDAEARIPAGDSETVPAAPGENSDPLDLDCLRRLISAGLRRSLERRDRGCAFPGCRRPPRDCHGHHVEHGTEGGSADLGTVVLLCAYHHRLLHRSGWEVRIASDGLPEFLPPRFLGKQRKPRRNNVHQPLPFAA
ncbi:HNH endonuclease signature motif containing protein [Amycolatopsis vancoresmycina]|uniref:HNH endonuclease n=1 Tax=Amycolatopsis vancoresmycina DSM 44592 TaxID=1292037 RepID=R1I1L0_9PSEU|nr:HNH endonuclease signature motif containing protein [Amycolatopsis vancoresmycina]EOD69710.1 HNH endonuclease [Amycolatopsis vancoresmycina DSM 44592]